MSRRGADERAGHRGDLVAHSSDGHADALCPALAVRRTGRVRLDGATNLTACIADAGGLPPPATSQPPLPDEPMAAFRERIVRGDLSYHFFLTGSMELGNE